ncbi:hypothetical protein GCK72_007767 [Caenorhabditis remanei]|uniref:Uncharacterized protein n=1 Tax=Caenorhabditis remanei TaxID=31234 RepID=A0A6A5HIV1_CAERE|nr:hypothetical protein GCK72_007767 [Caenorhabditis remanei]KAF1767808.1 hypothetical protein GCK72_007767 [Caenorhabditis remanei]
MGWLIFLIILIVLLCLAGAAAAFWFFYYKRKMGGRDEEKEIESAANTDNTGHDISRKKSVQSFVSIKSIRKFQMNRNSYTGSFDRNLVEAKQYFANHDFIRPLSAAEMERGKKFYNELSSKEQNELYSLFDASCNTYLDSKSYNSGKTETIGYLLCCEDFGMCGTSGAESGSATIRNCDTSQPQHFATSHFATATFRNNDISQPRRFATTPHLHIWTSRPLQGWMIFLIILIILLCLAGAAAAFWFFYYKRKMGGRDEEKEIESTVDTANTEHDISVETY